MMKRCFYLLWVYIMYSKEIMLTVAKGYWTCMVCNYFFEWNLNIIYKTFVFTNQLFKGSSEKKNQHKATRNSWKLLTKNDLYFTMQYYFDSSNLLFPINIFQ